MLEQGRAHEPVEVRAGDEPVALGGRGGHSGVIPPVDRPVRAESSVSGYHVAMRERGVVKQLWFWVIIAIALGIVVGLVAPGTAEKTKWLADAFIQLIKAVTGPVIFLTVVIGIASLGNLARAGGLALRALAYFFSMTVVALALGLIAANVFAPGLGLRRRAERVRAREARQGVDRRGRRHRARARRLHHRRPAAHELRPAVRRERDPAHPRAGDPRRGVDLDARRAPAQADPQRLRGRLEGHLRRDPADHVGRAARRVRRHGLHGRRVRRGLADEPRRADGRLLGHLRVLRDRGARRGRARQRASRSSA